MMTQQKILELAKQGNPQAIRALINHSLKPTGISVKVALKNECLMVIAESNNPLDRNFLVNFIRKGILNLEPQAVKRVVVQAHNTGNTSPLWRTGFNLDGEAPAEPQPLQKSINRNTATRIQPEEPAPTTIKPSSYYDTEEALYPPQSQSSFLRAFLLFLKFSLCTLLYVACGAIMIILAVSFKLGAILLAEQYFYNIQVIGEFFRSIEIIELVNILVFAILGMGFGFATILLPKKVGRWISALLLIILVPLVCGITYFVRYDNWIRELAEKDKVSYKQAETLTNAYLMKRVGHQGFVGFYIHTAEFPVLPTKQDEMQEVMDWIQRIVSKFSYWTRLPAKKITDLIRISGWIIRAFYFFIAAIATIIHFREGFREAQRIFKKAK